jgi:hypothetical protein
MSISKELIFAAAALARSSPENWQRFLTAFKGHCDELKDQCVASPVEMLQVTQGRAQAATGLLKDLTGANSKATELESRKGG